MKDDFIFTSESITKGHPDKLCDQVSDTIVDAFLTQDPNSSVEAECAIASGVLFLSTHYSSKSIVDITSVAREMLAKPTYPLEVFDASSCSIMLSVMDHTQTHYSVYDVDALDDQSIDKITSRHQISVFGYACDQTPELMPLPISLAHRLAVQLDAEKTKSKMPYLLPDGKAQVGIEYKQGNPVRVHSINLDTSQYEANAVDRDELYGSLIKHVINPVLKDEPCPTDDATIFTVNAEGLRFGGGPDAHAGLTGRKSSIDCYGSYARQSGPALSGKDPWRIDRIGAYIARYAAKNIVAAGLAKECEVQLSYAIGQAGPVSIRVRTFDTGEVDNLELQRRLKAHIDFRLAAVVKKFQLHKLPGMSKGKGFYQNLAVYGHMGRRSITLPWDVTDIADDLRT